jgi:hypothetical protein
LDIGSSARRTSAECFMRDAKYSTVYFFKMKEG